MKVFKFGGASVKDAKAVRNVATVLRKYSKGKLLVVVSAMGKTTNALEEIVTELCNRNATAFTQKVKDLKHFHLSIVQELFEDKNHPIINTVTTIINEISEKYNAPIPDNFDFEYDQLVSYGEVLSAKIIVAYLQEQQLHIKWMDARKLVRTNNNYRKAEVDWQRTEELIKGQCLPQFKNHSFLLTQGFSGHTAESLTTTLGREGSDFTAAIFAYCLNAESVTIWKDVPGMLNADPKYFDNTIKLDMISFYEAIELAYYGASVIHPKTVKPLQNKGIPLYVKSFVHPNEEGTVIQSSPEKDNLVPSFIFKMNQVLFSFTTKDFSFIIESHLSDIFHRLSEIGATINLMQNSALSFSILLDAKNCKPKEVAQLFSDTYQVQYNTGLELVTIRHYDTPTIERVTASKKIMLEQFSRQTARIVMKNK